LTLILGGLDVYQERKADNAYITIFQKIFLKLGLEQYNNIYSDSKVVYEDVIRNYIKLKLEQCDQDTYMSFSNYCKLCIVDHL
jgi:hypothetical protein